MLTALAAGGAALAVSTGGVRGGALAALASGGAPLVAFGAGGAVPVVVLVVAAALASGGAALAVSLMHRGVELLRRVVQFGPLGRGRSVYCAVGLRVEEQLRVCFGRLHACVDDAVSRAPGAAPATYSVQTCALTAIYYPNMLCVLTEIEVIFCGPFTPQWKVLWS